MIRYFPAPILLLLLLTLPGCVDNRASIPSLLPRDVERRDDLEPTRPTPVAKPDAALDTLVAEKAQLLSAATAAFDAGAVLAKPAIDAGQRADVGSDAWLDAQKALGEMDAAHSMLTSIIADLDRVAIDRANDGMPDYPSLAALRANAQRHAEQQEQIIAAAQAQIKRE